MFNDVIPLNISTAGLIPMQCDELNDVWNVANTNSEHYVNHAFRHYQDVLIENRSLWAWFQARKILLTEDLINQFSLGFADRSLCKGYPRSTGRQGELVRGAWQRLGILKPSGHQFFHGDVVFPFHDANGRIAGAYGRRISMENRPDNIYYHHWFSGKATFFNREALEKYSRLILCKSPIEALTLITIGIPNVISTMGIYSFSQLHLEDIERYQPSEIILAFDNTDEGNHVSGMIAQTLSTVDVRCLRLPLPRNKDINKVAIDNEDHANLLREIVDLAFPYSQTYENLARE